MKMEAVGRLKNRLVIAGHSVVQACKSRQEKGFSQESFPSETQIHRTHLNDLERGARNPIITVVEKPAEALKVKVGMLLD